MLAGVMLSEQQVWQGVINRQPFYELIAHWPHSEMDLWLQPCRILLSYCSTQGRHFAGTTLIVEAIRQLLHQPSEAFDLPIVIDLGAGRYQLLDCRRLWLAHTKIHELNLDLLRAAKKTADEANQGLGEAINQRTLELKEAIQALRQEMSERERAQEQLLHIALHDSLTQLPNRQLFMQELSICLQRAEEDPTYNFAILFIDCDRFKVINDSLGYIVGDQILIALSKRLENGLGPTDLLARLGEDEFVILLNPIQHIQEATAAANQIQKRLEQPIHVDSHEVFIDASIGIVSGQGYHHPENLMRDADTAMYQAKAYRKGRYQVFDPSMHTRAQIRLQIETDLRRAIEREEFQLHYQPIISLESGCLTGFEALVRWQHPDRGSVSPGEFIPVVEENGLIIPIGKWVIQEACRQLKAWHSHLKPGIRMNVNLSVRQFAQVDLIETIDRILAETTLDARYLNLEITESAMMENTEWTTNILKQLRSRHIQLSIDDFGTGYSSLSYLHRFHVDSLKVDRSFINSLPAQPEHSGIVQAIVSLANHLGISVTAEGVESANQARQLRAMQCDRAQGFLFSKPLEATAAEHFLRRDPTFLADIKELSAE